jgi:hypothetical protein
MNTYKRIWTPPVKLLFIPPYATELVGQTAVVYPACF